MEVEEEEDRRRKLMIVSEPSSRFFSLLASNDRDFLLSSHGTQVKISEIEDKVLGIYFSANWYSPCKEFNEILVETYEQVKTNFEVVFVSSDENLDAFNTYRASMPWLSIPFSDLATKKALDRRFNIEGIPCLVILQPEYKKDESTLHDGVELLYRFGEEAFPFTRERLDELELQIKEKYETQTLMNLLTNFDRDYLLAHPASTQIPVESLVGKTVGLFFSAQWCLPGVKFTSKLISIYHKIKQNQDFEIIYVSTDRDEEEFESYFNTMPWLTLPHQDTTIKTLAKHFDVKGIPCLIILGPDGKTITKNGRNLVNLYQENAYPFTEERVNLLEKTMDEEAKKLPSSEYHEGHRHELNLVSEGNGGGFYICCDCDEQGFSWAYQCLDCGYEIHPKCVKAVNLPASMAQS
ncbi:probable nucleoredoxin 2 isoform X2 [Euphorbia lathyris]|uniref:probable nucleoredoxin 2 isoform X2 n=1 Tax=Euphorbia lathyris TaxID=212925 RepID=UPI0033132502